MLPLTIKVILLVSQIQLIRTEFVTNVCGQLPEGHILSAAVYDGIDSIYFMGGDKNPIDAVQLDTVVRYDITTHQSEIVGRFPLGIYYGATEIDGYGNIFFFGGISAINGKYKTIYKLNGSNPAPVPVKDLTEGTYGMSAVSVGMDSIFLIGGFASSYSREIIHYNTVSNSLKVVAELPIGVYMAVSVYDGKNIFIFGGEHGPLNTHVYKFDPILHTVETTDVITPSNQRIYTASYIGDNQSIIISYDEVSSKAHFTSFHHDTEILVELVVDFLHSQLLYPVSVYVPKNKTIYFHGDRTVANDYSKNVYCIDLSEDYGVECPAEGLAFLPNPTDCAKYFICSDGEAFPAECKEGLLFDPELGKCNIAEEVDCPILQCPPDGISYLPVIGNCTQYILCIFGEGNLQECAEGTEFSPEEQGCVLDANYECPYTRIIIHEP